MYGNMTREEMITRLYEGNFATGELERQLIAKLFEQCCGGGGSSSGETLIVEIEPTADGTRTKFNKTVKEVIDACKTSNVVFMETTTAPDPEHGGSMTITSIYSLAGIDHMVNGMDTAYLFRLTGQNPSSQLNYVGTGDNDYPISTGRIE